MNKYGRVVALLAAATVWAASVAAAGESSKLVSTFDDIHYWIGEGTNRCGVVVDWAGYETAKAWGYRWNGTCTNLLEVVRRIAHEDPRLKLGVQRMGSFWNLYFFGYDVNDCHPAWDLVNGMASDGEALAHREDSESYSAWWVLYGPMNGATFTTSEQTSSRSSADQIVPRNDDWFAFSYGCPDYEANGVEVPAVLRQPEFAESPYGYKVVASFTDERKDRFNQAENVLGHPTMYMPPTMYWGRMEGGPVNPSNPACLEGEIFSLVSDGEKEQSPGEAEGPGYVTIAFDHDVIDDPANPYGIDFIVFGNSLGIRTTDDYYSQSDDPAKVEFNGQGFVEEAVVEVSQDNKAWFTFKNGPFADGAMPTLGYQYDPAKPDPNLFAGNLYWGKAARATRPVDPRIGFTDFKGLTLAEVCQRYNGSAGGTGYDISTLDLPKNEAGYKWFRYIRIKSRWVEASEGDAAGYSQPEVDAVADVAPVSDYERWVEANYRDWNTAWQSSVTGPEAIAANGKANAVNYILGFEATEDAADLDFRITSFVPGTTTHTLTLSSRRSLAAGCGLVVKRAERVDAPKRAWTTEMPAFTSSEQNADGTWTTTLTVSASGGSFFKLALDVE